MLEPIRLATPDEIEQIKQGSDLSTAIAVYAQDHEDGQKSLAVARTAAELDPIYGWDNMSGANFRKKLIFMWGLENHMRLSGVPAYFFNVPAAESSAPYRKVIEDWGATQVHAEPQIRYRKIL